MVPSHPARAQSAEQGTQQVVQFLQQHEYRQSLSQADQLLTTAPRDCRLLSLRGMALTGLQKSVEAEQSFKQALRNCPNDLLALEGAAQIAYAQRQRQDAVLLLQRILRINPENMTANAMLASIYRSSGKCEKALPYFAASAQMFPQRPQYQQAYAYCLADTAHYAQAAANYEQVLSRHPGKTARFNLALVQWKLHKESLALATLRPLLKDARQESVMTLGALLAEDTGDTPLAVKLLRAAIAAEPRDEMNYLEFAQIAFDHRSPQVGIDMLNAGLTQLPNAAQLYLARGVLEVQISHFNAAIADFQRAHKLAPQLSLAMDAMGIMESQQYKQTSALQLYRKEARSHPKDGLLQYLYAEALSEANPTKDASIEAIAAARKSVESEPGYAPARDLLALLYLRIHNSQQALKEAQTALKINPSDQVALYHEIMACRQLGQKTQVQELVKRLAVMRTEKARQQKTGHRYVLQDEITHTKP
ncbi:TPR domain protein [Acidobacterium capsulatum ATCC 51196]|uniref:TPR domain protein n=2 Tax=Acidobacteriaceae TaxID=204434 RepID=C1F7H3_ACIC5|nr:TPR domain protein [Acidobacterium capsulatum ATCC 51196]